MAFLAMACHSLVSILLKGERDMQHRLKFNPHGVVGVVFLVLMFGIAFFLNWNVNWRYFSIAVVLYSVAIISMTLVEERTRSRGYVSVEFVGFVGSIPKWLLGCHSGQAIRLFSPNLMSSIRSCTHFYMSFERKKRCLHPILFLEISPFVYLMGEA